MSVAEDLLEEASAPPAECVAFVGDNQTHGVINAVLRQYFADPLVRDGGTNRVIEYLSDNPAPRILIVDISDAPSPLTAIMSLSTALTDATQIVGIGSVNDINVYREILEAGAADYIAKPVTEKALAAALSRAEQPRSSATPSANKPTSHHQRIAVVGARGGVGSSTVAVNLAWLIAEEKKKKTVLVDLDLEFGTVALALDLEPTRGLREALENPQRIDSLFVSSATAKLTDNLAVMATEETLGGDLSFDPNAIDVLIEALSRSHEVMVLDVPRASFPLRQKIFRAVSSVVIVTDLSLSGLRDTLRLVGVIEESAPEVPIRIVANRAVANKQAMQVGDFQKALGRKVEFTIPDDTKSLNAAANVGKPVVQSNKRCKASKVLGQLVAALMKETPKATKSGFGGFMKALKRG